MNTVPPSAAPAMSADASDDMLPTASSSTSYSTVHARHRTSGGTYHKLLSGIGSQTASSGGSSGGGLSMPARNNGSGGGGGGGGPGGGRISRSTTPDQPSAEVDVNPSSSPTAAASNAAVVDQFISDAGGVGQYQRLSIAWLSLVVWPSLGLNVMGLVFVMQGVAAEFPDSQASLLPMSMFAGWMSASFVINRLADVHGRKPVVFGTLLGLSVFSFLRAFTSSFSVMVALHFPIGAFVGGAGSVSYVLVMETLPAYFKSTATSMKACGYAGAGAASAWVALRYPFWRHMCLVSSLPPAVALISYIFILESPRYFLSRGYVKSAKQALARIADTNGKPHATACLSRLVAPAVNDDASLPPPSGGSSISPATMPNPNPTAGAGGGGVTQIFSNPRLLLQASILWFAWFACSMSYYGLGYMAGNLGDVHTTTVLLNVIEIPAASLASGLVRQFGKKTVLGLSMGSAGTCLMLLASGQAGSLQQGLALAGKFSVCAAWIPAYVLATDVFPTAIRGTGIGLCNTTARFGAMISPLLVAQLSPSTCLVVFAGAGLLSGALVFRLPEALPAALVKASTGGGADALGAIKPKTRIMSV